MIDINSIKEHYANMLDSQLINITIEDGHALPAETFEILKNEFIKRRLDISYIASAEQKKLDIEEEKMQQLKESTAEQYDKMIWQHILKEKENNTVDSDIINGLVKRGMEEQEAIQTLSTVKDKLQSLIDKSDTQILAGGATFCIGVFITLATYSQAKVQGGIYIVAWGAILFGAIRFFRGFNEKQQYKALLEKMPDDITAEEKSHP